MTDRSIEDILKAYADYLEKTHNKLMEFYFSLSEDKKKKYRRILRASGDIYRAVVELKPSKKSS